MASVESELEQPSRAAGLLLMGINTLLQDGTFKIPSERAAGAYKIAHLLSVWTPNNQSKVVEFEAAFTKCLNSKCCLAFKVHAGKAHKIQREKMWTAYHSIRTSSTYQVLWGNLLSQIGLNYCPIFCQYVGNVMFRKMLMDSHQIDKTNNPTENPKPFTLEEISGLRYAAGYIVRLVRKKVQASNHPLKNDMLLCIVDLLEDGSEEECRHESKLWVDSVNRGGLVLVNDTTYELFFAMEKEFRRHSTQYASLDIDSVSHSIVSSDDVQFPWCILSCDWEESSAAELISMIIQEWIKIRGFSSASAWMEKLKVTQKQTTQKSKGLRKQLVSVQKN